MSTGTYIWIQPRGKRQRFYGAITPMHTVEVMTEAAEANFDCAHIWLTSARSQSPCAQPTATLKLLK